MDKQINEELDIFVKATEMTTEEIEIVVGGGWCDEENEAGIIPEKCYQ